MEQEAVNWKADQSSRPCAGFTLLEMLMGLAVISVASAVFLSFYISSVDMSRKAVSRTVASGLAQDQLEAMVQDPGRFFWDFEERQEDGLFPVRQEPGDPVVGNRFTLPAAMPLDQRAHRAQSSFYGRYRWLAFGRLAEPDATHYELSVLVHWVEAGRPDSLVLTASVPRFAVGEAP